MAVISLHDLADTAGGLRQLADSRVGQVHLLDGFDRDLAGFRDLTIDLLDGGGELLARGGGRLDIHRRLFRCVGDLG